MPDNAIYYELAYAATAIIYLGYGLSLWRRTRRIDERERAAAVAPERTPR